MFAYMYLRQLIKCTSSLVSRRKLLLLWLPKFGFILQNLSVITTKHSFCVVLAWKYYAKTTGHAMETPSCTPFFLVPITTWYRKIASLAIRVEIGSCTQLKL